MQFSRFAGYFSVFLLAACGHDAPVATAPATTGAAPAAVNTEVDPVNWGHLTFRITAAYLNQQLIDEYPGHAEGGNWTFLDCSAGSSHFVVGLQSSDSAGDNPAEHAFKGRAIIRTADRDAADAFLSVMADNFHTVIPEPLTPKPIVPLVFGTSILGTSLERSQTGAFVLGGGGTWTSTRWHISTPRLAAEVFFNYDIATQQGEFIEKDPSGRQDLMALWARILRDGPRGMRTPAEDRNVVTVGPHLGSLSPVAGPEAIRPFFVPGGKWLVYTTSGSPAQIWAVESAQPDHHVPVLELPVIYQVQSADPEAQKYVVEAKIPDIPGLVSNADPSRFVWLDIGQRATRVISGPWNPRNVDMDPNAISPDSSYLVISESRTREDNKGAFTQLYIVDLNANTAVTLSVNQQLLQTFGWQRVGDNLRLLVRTGLSVDSPENRQPILIDPATGDFAAATAHEVSPIVPPYLLAPDGQTIAVVQNREYLEIRRITGVNRTLMFNPEDRRFVDEKAVAWLDSRYLSFFNPYPIIIDTRIMKMNYLFNSDRSPNDVIYSPDFRYAAIQTDDGLSIGPILDVPGH